jgi:hypothetical protein
MKATITKDGVLNIDVDNELEQYALSKWLEAGSMMSICFNPIARFALAYDKIDSRPMRAIDITADNESAGVLAKEQG